MFAQTVNLTKHVAIILDLTFSEADGTAPRETGRRCSILGFSFFGSADRASANLATFQYEIVGGNCPFQTDAIADPIRVISSQIRGVLIERDCGIRGWRSVGRIEGLFLQIENYASLIPAGREGEFVINAADKRKIRFIVWHISGPLPGLYNLLSLRPSSYRDSDFLIGEQGILLGRKAFGWKIGSRDP